MLMMPEGNNVVRQVVNAKVYGTSDILGLLVLIGLVVGCDSFSLYLVCKCGYLCPSLHTGIIVSSLMWTQKISV
jgi:hypothetical protein